MDGAEDGTWRSERVAVEVRHPHCGMTFLLFTLSTDALEGTRTTHVSFPSSIGVTARKDPVIPSIHTCYYTYKPR